MPLQRSVLGANHDPLGTPHGAGGSPLPGQHGPDHALGRSNDAGFRQRTPSYTIGTSVRRSDQDMAIADLLSTSELEQGRPSIVLGRPRVARLEQRGLGIGHSHDLSNTPRTVSRCGMNPDPA